MKYGSTCLKCPLGLTCRVSDDIQKTRFWCSVCRKFYVILGAQQYGIPEDLYTSCGCTKARGKTNRCSACRTVTLELPW